MPRPIPNDFLYAHAEEIEGILRRAVRDALLLHKRLRNPIATSKGGRVVIIPPDEIPVEDDGRPIKLPPF